MAKVKAEPNPRVLEWAREDAGLTLTIAARKIGVHEMRLQNWERGVDQPTIPQLRKAADVYKRPLAAFYLHEVPQTFRVGHDFRRLPGEIAGIYSSDLRLELRNAVYHRDVALDLYRELGEDPPVFEYHANARQDPEDVATGLRHYLGVEGRWRDEGRAAFNRWREAVESRGVLVFQITRPSLEELRGVSIAVEPLPVIAVNRRDAPVARVFSILHELTHIAMRDGGLCDINDSAERAPEEQAIEFFCNHVAGATLVPRAPLLAHPLVRRHTSHVWTDDTLYELARSFGASREVVLRRLLILGRTSEAFYREARQRFLEERIAALSERNDEREFGGRNMPGETIGVLGRRFVDLVLQTYHNDRITLSDVSTYLGVRVKHLPRIEQMMSAL